MLALLSDRTNDIQIFIGPNLHHSIPPNEIQAELETLGHKVRNVLNIRHRVTKEPLPLYFIDLEPQDNNKSIYELQLLCNMKIVVEAPRKKKSPPS